MLQTLTQARKKRGLRTNILARSPAPFENRNDAGRKLGMQLTKYQSLSPIVVGIARGGVIVASEVAKVLDAELDVVCVRKITAPGDPSCVVGAVCEDGSSFLDDIAVHQNGPEPDGLQKERLRQLADVADSARRFRAVRAKVGLWRRVVILVDDGISTGETMHAAIWTVMKERPKAVIAAVPVGPEGVLDAIAGDADNIVCLRAPAFLDGVEESYMDFPKLTDREVMETISRPRPQANAVW